MLSVVNAGEERRWFRFLSRWSLFAGLAVLGLLLTFSIGILPASQDSELPQDYFELAAAISNPAVYRLAITLDIAVWLALGGFFITLAAVIAPRAPIRGTLIAACGVGQVAGIIGAFLRLNGTSDLAGRYEAAATDQQEALLRSYLDLQLVFSSHFDAGALLWSVALVLTASIAWSMSEFRRWLTILIALPGIMVLAQQVVGLLTDMDLGFLFFPAILLLMVVFFATSWLFWRRTPELITEGGGAAG